MLNQVAANNPPRNTWTSDDQRNMQPLVVTELLASGMADAVIGHEEDNGLIKNSFRLQSLDDLPNLAIGEADGIEVVGPIFQDDWIARVVRRKPDILRIDLRSHQVEDLAIPGMMRTLAAVLTSMKLHLREEGLVGFSIPPIIGVVDGGVPFEVVIGLAETVGSLDERSSNRREIARPLEEYGDRFNPRGEMNLFFPATTSMMVGSDGGLVTAGDEGRPTRGADRSGDKCLRKSNPALSESIDMGGLDELLTVAGKVCRHIVDDDPNDVGRLVGRMCWDQSNADHRDENEPTQEASQSEWADTRSNLAGIRRVRQGGALPRGDRMVCPASRRPRDRRSPSRDRPSWRCERE